MLLCAPKRGARAYFAGTLITPEGKQSYLWVPAAFGVGGRGVAITVSDEWNQQTQEVQIPEEVLRVRLLGVIEILMVTPKARKSIESVPVWKA